MEQASTVSANVTEISSVTAEDAATPFDCGEHSLNDFLARHALKNHVSGIGKTYVLRRLPPSPPSIRVIGYSTVAMSSAASVEISTVEAMRLPKYPIPVGLIAKLAVHVAEHGNGWGERLLIHALRIILAASETVGCMGVIVDALSESAVSFYRRYGFEVLDPSAPFPRRMYLPLATIRALTNRQ